MNTVPEYRRKVQMHEHTATSEAYPTEMRCFHYPSELSLRLLSLSTDRKEYVLGLPFDKLLHTAHRTGAGSDCPTLKATAWWS